METREIKLTRGFVAIVDAEDYDYLMQWKWQAQIGKSGVIYACRSDYPKDGKRTHIRMHRVIMGLGQGRDVLVDHIDHDGRNNRKSNLRLATSSQNNANTTPRKGTTSKYLGVNLKKQTIAGKEYAYWYVRVQKDGKRYSGGFHATEEEAALAYNKLALEHFGEFANLNIIQ